MRIEKRIQEEQLPVVVSHMVQRNPTENLR